MLCFGSSELRNFKITNPKHCNVRCPRGVYHLVIACIYGWIVSIPYYIYVRNVYISAWTSRCLFRFGGQCEGLELRTSNS